MTKSLLLLSLLLPTAALAQPVSSSYATQNGRAGTVVIACPSQDGSFTAGPCPMSKPGPVTYSAPGASAISVANTPVTVFPAGSVTTGCDFVNTGSVVLYLDFTKPRLRARRLRSRCSRVSRSTVPTRPPGPSPAVASQAQSFVAVRY